MEFLILLAIALGAWIFYYNKKHGAEEAERRKESIEAAQNRKSYIETELEKDEQRRLERERKKLELEQAEEARRHAYEVAEAEKRRAYELAERVRQQEEFELKNGLLNSLKSGVIPEELKDFPVDRLSILLTKSERLIYGMRNLTVITTKTKTRYVGGSRGMSFRIAKGVSIRAGGMRGHAEKYEDSENLGPCEIYITDRNLYVKTSSSRVKKCPTSQIIAIEPYSNGIQIEFNRLLPLFIKVTGQDRDIMIAALKFNVRFLSE